MKPIRKLNGCLALLSYLFFTSQVTAQTLPNGNYDTADFGTINIECISSEMCFGTYENGQSYLYLNSRDNSQNFTGYWVEAESSKPCAETHQFPNLQSNAWGNLNVTFDLSANSLSGFWGYCEDHPNKALDSTRAQMPTAQDSTSVDVVSMAQFLVGSWLPSPDSSARRNDTYTFNPDGTFVISDGSSNSPLGSWTLNSTSQMIMDGRVDEPISIEIVGQDIKMGGQQYTQEPFNGLSYDGQSVLGDVQTEGVFQPKWPSDGTTPVVGNYELSFIVLGPVDSFRPSTADASSKPIYVEFWNVTEPTTTDVDGREVRKDIVGFWPTEYKVGPDSLSFHGYHPQWGDIYFDARFDSTRVQAQYQYERMGGGDGSGVDKPAKTDEPLIFGDMLVRGHIFRDVALYIGWFD
jgi:hypothetical protein